MMVGIQVFNAPGLNGNAVALPMIVVYFMAQRYFIEGITFSGLKG